MCKTQNFWQNLENALSPLSKCSIELDFSPLSLACRMVLCARPFGSGKIILIKNSVGLKSAPSVTASSTPVIIVFHSQLARPASTNSILLACTNGSRPLTNQRAHCVRHHSDHLVYGTSLNMCQKCIVAPAFSTDLYN